jgi:hypothetical protein
MEREPTRNFILQSIHTKAFRCVVPDYYRTRSGHEQLITASNVSNTAVSSAWKYGTPNRDAETLSGHTSSLWSGILWEGQVWTQLQFTSGVKGMQMDRSVVQSLHSLCDHW